MLFFGTESGGAYSNHCTLLCYIT